MRDPYLYEDSQVLKNKLNIRTQNELDDAEADYVWMFPCCWAQTADTVLQFRILPHIYRGYRSSCSRDPCRTWRDHRFPMAKRHNVILSQSRRFWQELKRQKKNGNINNIYYI